MSLVALMLSEPWLFDCLAEGGPIGKRGDHPMQLYRDLNNLNRLNGLTWRVKDWATNLADALTGSNERNGLQIAHILPHATGKEPALWLFCRVLGLAPWGPETAVRRHKESIANLIHLPKSFHATMDAGHAEAILRLSHADLIDLIMKVESYLAEQETAPSMAQHPQVGKWQWDVGAVETSNHVYRGWHLVSLSVLLCRSRPPLICLPSSHPPFALVRVFADVDTDNALHLRPKPDLPLQVD